MRLERLFALLVSPAVLMGLHACGRNGRTDREEQPPSQDWVLVEDTLEAPGLHTQGLASVPTLGASDFIFTSQISIDHARVGEIVASKFGFPRELQLLEFDHMGDPDAHGSLVYVGIEDNSEPSLESFHRGVIVYDADTFDVVSWAHDPGSADRVGDGDAPWVAVSPDGNWLVTGEWEPMQRLIVYETRRILSGHEIEAKAVIPVDRPPRFVQGCDFDGPSVLLCASDDADAGRLVYAVFLSRSLQEKAFPKGITAEVHPLFPTPAPEARCEAEQEVEGVDVDGDNFRVLVIGSCLVDSHLYRYERCKGNCFD